MTDQEECKNYLAGRCRFGADCRRKHVGDIAQDNIRDPDADVSTEVCKNYLAGKCRQGEKCRRIHEGDVPQDNIEERSTRGTSRKREPRERKPRAPRDPNADVSSEVCNNYLAGRCRLGENCRRIHEGDIPQAAVEKLDEICNNFKEGRCNFGDNCRRKHE